MKRSASFLISLCALVVLLAGCQINPFTKALVVVNNGSTPISAVTINQYITQSSKTVLRPNALLNGATIPVGGQEKFYLSPFSYSVNSSGYASLFVDNGVNSTTVRFTFDAKVYDDLTATFDGTNIVMSGSGVLVDYPQ